jgi:hypothetical protein
MSAASQGIKETTVITGITLLDRDLGITGDDGIELLEELQERFGVSFAGADGTLGETFGLEKGEFLFESEGVFHRMIEAAYTLAGNRLTGWRELTLDHGRHVCSPEQYAARRPAMQRIARHLRASMLVEQP